MSEERRRRALAGQLKPAAARISVAIQKLARAASTSLGSDCYLHADLGRSLLLDVGFEANLVAGAAAWRVGEGDGDIIGHTPRVRSYQAPGGGLGMAYHAWLDCGGIVIDFTTYQLRRKAQLLDAADGGRTAVLWCPDYLLIEPTEIRRHEEVAAAPFAGVVHYEPCQELLPLLRSQYTPDPETLQIARWVLAHPQVGIFGPNDLVHID